MCVFLFIYLFYTGNESDWKLLMNESHSSSHLIGCSWWDVILLKLLWNIPVVFAGEFWIIKFNISLDKPVSYVKCWSCSFKWNPLGQSHKLPGWTLNRESWWLWFLWIYACYVFAGAETQTAVMMFGWNEMHQTCSSIRTDWAFMLKCRACQEMMPVMSAAHPWYCHKVPRHKPSGDAAANTVLSTHFHTLEMGFSPSNSRERNKQIECKYNGKKSKGEKGRNDMGNWFL